MLARTAILSTFCAVALAKVHINFYSDDNCGNYAASADIVKPTDSFDWVYNAGSVLIGACTDVLPNQNECKVEFYWQGTYQGGLTAKTPGGSGCLKLAAQNDHLTTTAIRYYNVYQG